jgi:hypothetical protein
VNDRGQIRSTSREDTATERVVLQQVLSLHPAAITLDELAREIDGDEGELASRDAIERAVRDLAGAGLLHHNAPFVLPTRAALRFDQLLGC